MMKKYLYSNQETLFGEREIVGFGYNEFYVKEISKTLANKTIINNHYSKKIYNATYIHLGVFMNNEFLGVLQYGYAMNPASCSKIVKDTKMDEYLELNRMWLSDECPRNSESKSISFSLKYIRKKYPKCKWIQSFADERCGGFGIVYQACSFGFYGEHISDFWEYKGEVFHDIQMTLSKEDRRYNKTVHRLQTNKDKAKRMKFRQFRYLKFIKNKYKKDCLLKELPYLKHYNND